MSEAPASCNFMMTYKGIRVQFTIRDEDEYNLYGRLYQFIDYLEAEGLDPLQSQQTGNGGGLPPAPVSAHVSAINTEDPSWCAVHNVRMKERQGKQGPFYSHKNPDGSWCNPQDRR